MSMALLPQQVAAVNRRFAWLKTARPEQVPRFADGKTVWLALAGRGFGKSRSIYEEGWWRCVERPNVRACVVAPTLDDLRKVTFFGKSGFQAVTPPEVLKGASFETAFNKNDKLLTFWNGSTIQGFSAETPDRLRGPEHELALCEELAAWPYLQETWDMMRMGLRIGDEPKTLIATTPRPLPLVRQLIARADVEVVRGSTFDNAANLAPKFLDELRDRYAGTRLGRQELDAEILDDVPGALWTRAMIDAAHVKAAPARMSRIVVAIDPSGTRGEEDDGDSVGIVIAGKGDDGLGYVLADRTCKLSPAGWGRVAVEAYREFRADRIIGERNFGGAMVEAVIRSIDPRVSYRDVVASRGKVARAEPVAALYEQGRIRHVGAHPALEDQMVSMTGDGYLGDGSPDRVDALVWAITELMLGKGGRSMVGHL
jgi:phage terminase large subunit-like protein